MYYCNYHDIHIVHCKWHFIKGKRTHCSFLAINPIIDAFVVAIHQLQLPAFKEAIQQVQETRTTQQSHEWKDDGDGRYVLHHEDKREEANLQNGI